MNDAAERLAQAIRDVINEAVQAAVERESPTPPPARDHVASILDRLSHHASIVVTSGESYRMRHADHSKKGATT